MDKNEYNLKLQEINKYVEQGSYEEAARTADQIEWKRVRNIHTLCLISEVYEAVDRLDTAKELLVRAYRRAPIGKTVLYRLTEITIKLKQFDEAIEYYSEYVQAAPHDNNRYILKYKIYRGRGSSLDEQIDILKEYLDQEFNEKYAYELIRLYQQADRIQECLNQCDDLVLWFQSGHYVLKALEMKQRYAKLTPKQQVIYERELSREELGEEEEELGQERQMVSPETTGEADSIVEDTAREIAETVKASIAARSAENELSEVAEEQAEGRTTAAENAEETEDGKLSDNTVVMDTEALRAALRAQGEDAPGITAEQLEEVLAGTEYQRDDEQKTADGQTDAVEDGNAPDAQSEAGQPAAEEPMDITPAAENAAVENADKEARKISYNAESLQEDVAQSVRQIMAGVGIRDTVDPDEEVIDEVIERSKKDQEGSIAARENAAGVKMNSRLHVPVKKGRTEAGKLSIDDVLLSMGEKGTAVREAVARAGRPAKSQPAGVLSAVDEALLNMGVSPENLDEGTPKEQTLPGTMEELQTAKAEVVQEVEEVEDAVDEPETVQEIEGAADEPETVQEVEDAADGSDAVRDVAGSDEGETPEDTAAYVTEADDISDAAEDETAVDEDLEVTDTEDVVEAEEPEEPVDTAEETAAAVESAVEKIAKAAEHLPEYITEEDEEEQEVNREETQEKGQAEEPEEALPVYEVTRSSGKKDKAEQLLKEDETETSEGDLEETFVEASEDDSEEEPEEVLEEEFEEGLGEEIEEGLEEEFEEDFEEELDESSEEGYDLTEDDDEDEADGRSGDTGQNMSMEDIVNARTRRIPRAEIERRLAENAEAADGAEAEQEEEPAPRRKQRMLPPSVRGYFDGFTDVPDLEMQIDSALRQALGKGKDRTSRSGNILIFGAHGSGKTTLAASLAKAIGTGQNKEFVKMAKIYATELNRRDIAATVARIAGGILIIEEAGDMEDSIADQLTTAMEFRTDGLIIIMEDEERYLRSLMIRHPRLMMKFTSQIILPQYDANDLLNFAELMAQEKLCTLSAEAADALADRAERAGQEGTPLTLIDLRAIVDRAVKRSGKLSRKLFGGKGRYNEEGFVLLTAKDLR